MLDAKIKHIYGEFKHALNMPLGAVIAAVKDFKLVITDQSRYYNASQCNGTLSLRLGPLQKFKLDFEARVTQGRFSSLGTR